VRLLVLLTLFYVNLFSLTITNHNVYKQKDSIDLMLTFDEAYFGKISQKKEDGSTILMLDNIKIKEKISEDIESKILQKITVLPYKEKTFIKVDAKNPYTIEASKTVDNQGLRIRIKPKSNLLQTLETKKFETKKESDLSGSFFRVVLVLAFLLALLYLLKRWLTKQTQTGGSWLFDKTVNSKDNINVIQQKMLDAKNRVSVIEYQDSRYLVILGASNLLLDKFEKKGSEFESLLEKNSKKLDDMLDN